MLKELFASGLAFCVVGSGFATVAMGSTVAVSTYSTQAPWAPYSPGNQYQSITPLQHWGLAYRFTAQASGQVQSIEAGIVAKFATSSVQATLSIHDDDPFFIPGQVRGSFPVTLETLGFDTVRPPSVFTPTVPIDLVAGQTYWLAFEGDLPSGTSAPLQWFLGDTSVWPPSNYSASSYNGVGQNWITSPTTVYPGAFKIVVPGPAAGALPLVGAWCFGVRRRRR